MYICKYVYIYVYICTIYLQTSGISRFFVDILVLAFITQKFKPSKNHNQKTGFSTHDPSCHPGASVARGSTSHFGHDIDDEIVGYQSSQWCIARISQWSLKYLQSFMDKPSGCHQTSTHSGWYSSGWWEHVKTSDLHLFCFAWYGQGQHYYHSRRTVAPWSFALLRSQRLPRTQLTWPAGQSVLSAHDLARAGWAEYSWSTYL